MHRFSPQDEEEDEEEEVAECPPTPVGDDSDATSSAHPKEEPEAPPGSDEGEASIEGEVGAHGRPASPPVAFFLGEDQPLEGSSVVSLRDIMSGESSTDPDPGVLSIDAKRGPYKAEAPQFKEPSTTKVSFILGNFFKKNCFILKNKLFNLF